MSTIAQPAANASASGATKETNERVAITFFAAGQKAKGSRRTATWPKLFAKWAEVGPPKTNRKDELRGWSPATFRNDHRRKGNVETVAALVTDIDNTVVETAADGKKAKRRTPEDQLVQIDNVLNATPANTVFAYTSWSHAPDWPRFRAVYPLSRAVGSDEYETLWQWLRGQYDSAGIAMDEACKDASRLWYVPARRDDNFATRLQQGESLDVDAILGEQAGDEVAEPGEAASVELDPNEVPLERRIERATQYARKFPGAVSGADGHKTTFRLACQLVRGFLLPVADALRILESEHSPRCDPPWSEKELRHKVDQAATEARSPELGARLRRWRPSGSERTATGENSPGKPDILIRVDEREVADEAVNALSRDRDVYQRGYRLVRVVREPKVDSRAKPGEPIVYPPGSPKITALSTASLRERLADAASWLQRRNTRKGAKDVPAHPPDWATNAVRDRQVWDGIPVLAGITEAPVLRPDGSVLDRPGYDAETGLLLVPNDEFEPLGERPSQTDAMSACREILDVVCDVPFEAEAHKAAWLAAVLTGFARWAIAGPAPIFIVDANVRGSGKNLVADCAAAITTGRVLPRLAHRTDDEEVEKQITSIAIAGDSLVLIDNVRGVFGGKSWEAAATATVWKGRRLGVSETVECPLNVTWWATGNNVELSGDMPRRVCHIRLRSDDERPEDRDPQQFRHPALLRWVLDNRPRLVRAALTVLRAYVVAGRPEQEGVRWGSFEGWANLVASAVVWCGYADPCKTKEALEVAATSDGSTLGAFLRGWQTAFGDDSHTVAEVLRLIADEDQRVARHRAQDYLDDDDEDGSAEHRYLALRDALMELCPGRDSRLPSARSLGRKLGHLRARVVDGWTIDQDRDRTGTARWRVSQVVAGSAGSRSGCSEPEREPSEADGAGSAGSAGVISPSSTDLVTSSGDAGDRAGVPPGKHDSGERGETCPALPALPAGGEPEQWPEGIPPGTFMARAIRASACPDYLGVDLDLDDGSLDTTLTYPLDDQTWQATWGWSGERNAEGQAIGFTRTQVVAIRYVCEKGKEPHRVLRFVSTQDEPDDENDDVMGEV